MNAGCKAAAQAAGEHRAYVLREAAFLLDCRVWPPEIAARLGYQDVASLRTTLMRWRERELADRFRADRWDPDVEGRTYAISAHGKRRAA